MAKVYVGTWKKYNEGNLAGQWLDLSDFHTYADFLRKCSQIHSDERDAEYMIQDTQEMPDGLDITDWLGEEDFNDIKKAMQGAEEDAPQFEVVDYSEKAIAVTGDTRPICDKLKSLGGRFNPRLTCGPGWIFPKTKESEVRAVLAGGKVSEGRTEREGGNGSKALRAEYLVYVEQMNDTEYWKAKYRKNPDYAVKLSDGWCIIDKPRIENKFCFHDEGPDYELYNRLMADNKKLERYFLNKNLSGIDTEIERLKNEKEPLYTRPLNNNAVEVLTHHDIYRFYDYLHGNKEARQITAEERASLLSAYTIVRTEFNARLQTYLKRYGTSKLHTWTYWADA